MRVSRVADPNPYNADPDPDLSFHFNADPDLIFYFHADADPLLLIKVMGICD